MGGDFEEVLAWLDWWDCPRFGAALIHGVPFLFDCQFSEELDEYPDEYEVWPASVDELRDVLEVFDRFTAWRKRFDADEVTGAHDADLGPSAQRVRARLEQPRPEAKVAAPEWRLDRTASLQRQLRTIECAGGSDRDPFSRRFCLAGRLGGRFASSF
jgi:hypothetical protein